MLTSKWNEEEDREVHVDDDVENDQWQHGDSFHANDAYSTIINIGNAPVGALVEFTMLLVLLTR
jgi:hypothetical protein